MILKTASRYYLYISSLFPQLRYWFVCAIFFFAHFFVRVAPPLIAINLMREYQLSLKHIGFLSSLYFLTYTLSQLVTGLILKHYSTRLLLSEACLGCAIMALALSLSSDFTELLLSLLGYAFFGSFAFIGATSYAARNLPQHSSFLTGITKSFGMAGGFMAMNGIAWAILHYSWRLVIRSFSLGLAIWSLVIFFFGPRDSYLLVHQNDESDQKSRREIYDDRRTWLTALYSGFVYFPMMVFTEGGFGPRLLGSVHPQSSTEIAFAISMIFIASMIGFPLCGYISDRYGQIRIMEWSALSGFVTAGIAVFMPMPCWALSLCLFIFGVSNTGLIAAYALAMNLHGPNNASISIAIANMGSVFIGSIIGAILPTILETTSQAIFVQGVPYYDAWDYQRVFGSMILATPLCAYYCAKKLGKIRNF